MLVDSSSKDFVHHMTTYECDPSMIFDNKNDFPSGLCDDLTYAYSKCMSNVANGWAVGGDHVGFFDILIFISNFPKILSL